MGTRDLINLGIAPDSGTGDSARKGGTKINDLFADIYTQFGDNPISTDNTKAFYGYRRTFSDFEYKVGELHPAGRYTRIGFRKTDAYTNSDLYNDSDGYTYLFDSDGDGIPNLFADSEFYFLSRGEQVDVDLTGVNNGHAVNLVLPLANAGDTIRIRESRDTFPTSSGINIWTTPYAFADSDQREEWSNNNGNQQYPNSKHTHIRDYDGTFKNCSIQRKTTSHSFLDYDIAFGGYEVGNVPRSNVRLTNPATIYNFVYLGHTQGWVFNTEKVYYSTGKTFEVHTDSWDSDQWVKLSSNITISGVEQVASGHYMLPITSGTTGTTSRDFKNITRIMNVRVYKKINQGGAASAQAEVVERLRHEMRRALDSETDSDSARAIRFKTVLGGVGDSDSEFDTQSYTGFDDVDDMYIPQTLTSFIDNKGNTVVFNSTPFKGAAVVISFDDSE